MLSLLKNCLMKAYLSFCYQLTSHDHDSYHLNRELKWAGNRCCAAPSQVLQSLLRSTGVSGILSKDKSKAGDRDGQWGHGPCSEAAKAEISTMWPGTGQNHKAPGEALPHLTVKSDVSMLPRVGPFSTMKLRSPVKMVETDHAGFHVSGWKSVMERHSLKENDFCQEECTFPKTTDSSKHCVTRKLTLCCT